MKRMTVIIAVFFLASCSMHRAYAQGGAEARRASSLSALAAGFLDESSSGGGLRRGIASVLGGRGASGADLARFAIALSGDEDVLVHVWERDQTKVDAARSIIDTRHLHGRSIVAELASNGPLPYADNTIDLLIGLDWTYPENLTVSAGEVLRVLRPRGRAFIGRSKPAVRNDGLDARHFRSWAQGAKAASISVVESPRGVWLQLTKPRPEGEGDWSHIEHGPDNNPVAGDVLIKAPYMTKWLGKPYYIAMPAVTVAAAGRIYLATGHIAHHQREEPWLNTLIARNGYNGTILWKRKLPDGYLVHRSAFIADGDLFYMIDSDGSGLVILDGETGEERGRVDSARTRGQWKWMAIQDGRLYALIGGKSDPPETTIVRSDRTHWSWGELSKGYYSGRIPWGFGERIVAIDLASKDLIWERREKTPIDSRGMVLGGGGVFYYCPDELVGSLDASSGKPRWQNRDKDVRKLIEEKARGLLSTPGFRTMSIALFTPKALVVQGQTRMNVVALSTEDGRKLWNRKKTTNNPNALSLDGSLVLGIGKRGSSLLVDPVTGETLGDLGFTKRSCARLTATSDSLFCRGMPEGLTRFDRKTKKVFFNGAVRPSCNDGVVAANGLLYMGPWSCDCNLSLIGRVVMCSAGSYPLSEATSMSGRLQVSHDGPATPDGSVGALQVDASDWSTYRGDASRSASTPVEVPEEAIQLWSYRPEREIQATAITTAGPLLFFGADDGKMRAISSGTGRLAWTFATAGPILQPPTVWNGSAYFGSADGYVYCVDALGGKLRWRFRAAPHERRIPIYGKLSSTWPVHSGVLIKDGVAYAAAGIIDYDGTHVYALDAKTGKLVWQNNSSGHLDRDLRKGVSAQGFLTASNDRLWMPGGNVISPAAYMLFDGSYAGTRPGDGSPRTNRGEEIGMFRDHVLLGGRLRFSSRKNVVDPGYFSLHPVEGKNVGSGIRITQGKTAPAWNDRYFAIVPRRGAAPVWYRSEDVADILDWGEARRRGKTVPVASAHALERSDTLALAMAPNAVLALSERTVAGDRRSRYAISAFHPETGGLLWRHLLPGQAILGGLAIDREGRVLAQIEGGRIIAYGGGSSFLAKMRVLVDHAKRNPAGKPAAIRELRSILPKLNTGENIREIMARLGELGVDVDLPRRDYGTLMHWNVIGPFPWNDENPLDKVFVGEPTVDTGKPRTFGKRLLKWRPRVTVDAKGFVDVAAIYGKLQDAAVYAHAEFRLENARPIVLRIGTNDGYKCWFNGKAIHRFEEGRSYAADDDSLAVEGRVGWNRILLKVVQMGNNWAYGVRVTDEQGRPVALESRN